MIDAFQVLLHWNRVAKRSDAGAEILRETIAEDFEELVYPSLRVARAEAGPVVKILEEFLQENSAPILCMTLSDAMPEQTVVLARFATLVLEQKLRLEATLFDRDFAEISLLPGVRRFPAEIILGVRLHTAIETDTSEEAFTKAMTKAHLAGISRTLVELGKHHRSLNELATALSALERAEELATILFEANADDFREFYSEIAMRLAWTLLELGRVNDARSWAVRVFKLYEEAKDAPVETLRIIAETGLLTSMALTAEGDTSGALHLGESAVRDFASFNSSGVSSSEHIIGLAAANYAKTLQRAGRLNDAVTTVDALNYDLTNLAVLSSDAFLPLYCRGLIISAEVFLLAGHVSRALKSADYAVTHARKLHSLVPKAFTGFLCRAMLEESQVVWMFKGAPQAIETLNSIISLASEWAMKVPEVRHASACAFLLRSACWLEDKDFARALDDILVARKEFTAVATLYPFFDPKHLLTALVIQAEALAGLARYPEALGLIGAVETERTTLRWSVPAEHTIFTARTIEVKARLLLELGHIKEAGPSAIFAEAQCRLWQGEKPITFAAQHASCLNTLGRACLAAGDEEMAAECQAEAVAICVDYERRGLRILPTALLIELSC